MFDSPSVYLLKVPVNTSSQKNESLCSISDNIFFTMSGFDAPQMNFVSAVHISLSVSPSQSDL